jgi:ABC-type transport system substrate-binding protein
MKRRETLALVAAAGATALAPGLVAARAAPGSPQRVLRYAFPVAESSFDPAQISDVYSRTVTCHIFESPLAYDHLARPAKFTLLTAAALPEASDDYRTWTVRLRPGIFFADDPAFGGPGGPVRRELVAEDYVYSFKRFADPAVKSPLWATMDQRKFLGLAELRRRALKDKQPFDYDQPIEGIRALDRYTLQLRVADPLPRLPEMLATSGWYGAVAREVAERYGDRIGEHPVGTGPFKLVQWRRSSLIVLERNPTFRERLWEADPAPDDAEGQTIAARLRGRRLPLVDRVEVSIIEAEQPRWLSFLNGQADLIDRLPNEFIDVAMPGGTVAPNLARQGIRGQRVLTADVTMTFYNMEDPVIGGYTPERVALRRAMNLAVNLEREIRSVRRGMAIPAQSPVLPHMSGYDPAFKSENSDHDPARARALLDLYGWVDRDGDGWREQPDGSPLELECATQPDQATRALNELWQKALAAIGIRIRFKTAKWPENLKAARAGQLQMWGVASSATSSDGQAMLTRYYGPQSGQQNLARFALPEFDALHDRLSVLPDGPEREALFTRAKRLAVAYAPYKLHVHRIVADLMHPRLVGYRRPVFWNEWWHFVDVELSSSLAGT